MPSKLYVGNLAYSVTQEDLEEFFSQAGTVVSAVVVSDKMSGQSRGFGFVEMADEESAMRAIETLNDADLKGRRLKIDQAREGGGPGGPRGGGGGRGGRGGERGGGGRGFGKRY
jgi:cold-inducible RNA-binding protein